MVKAEFWYRHVLSFATFSPDATRRLVSVLNKVGQAAESARLCSQYKERIGNDICV